MKTSLDHLPEGKQRELALVVKIFFEEFEAVSARATQQWKGGRILKVVLSAGRPDGGRHVQVAAACRATKSVRACDSQVINVRFQPAQPRNFGDGDVGVHRLRSWRTADATGQAVTASPPPSYPQPTQHLRNAAARLAAELDDARLYRAAAYVSAVDSIDLSSGQSEPDGDMRTDVELDFELDEHGRVRMIREGDCHIIGRKNAVCVEMRRFLREVVLGDGI